MRRLKISLFACPIIAALAGGLQLSGCAQGAPDSVSGMIGGRGPDYNAHS